MTTMRTLATRTTRSGTNSGSRPTRTETTAAATGAVGVVRRDPMAMLPFIGYNAGDYVNHWLEIGKQADEAKLPKIYQVNWFRRDDEDGSFLWPGFGDNARVLKWIIQRLEGKVDAIDSPIGLLPKPEDIDVSGLDMPAEDVAKGEDTHPESVWTSNAKHSDGVQAMVKGMVEEPAFLHHDHDGEHGVRRPVPIEAVVSEAASQRSAGRSEVGSRALRRDGGR